MHSLPSHPSLIHDQLSLLWTNQWTSSRTFWSSPRFSFFNQCFVWALLRILHSDFLFCQTFPPSYPLLSLPFVPSFTFHLSSLRIVPDSTLSVFWSQTKKEKAILVTRTIRHNRLANSAIVKEEYETVTIAIKRRRVSSGYISHTNTRTHVHAIRQSLTWSVSRSKFVTKQKVERRGTDT